MNKAPLRGIEACVFDAYGTLFDFAAATRRCKGELDFSPETMGIERPALREGLMELYLTPETFPGARCPCHRVPTLCDITAPLAGVAP